MKLYELKEKTPCVIHADGRENILCDSREQAIRVAEEESWYWSDCTVYCALNPGMTFWLCHPGEEGRFVNPITPDWEDE